MKPNFILIGAMKCATTSLCDILREHSQVFVTKPKEPDFFCDDSIFARGWTWYESLYEDAVGKVAIGEGSTGYTKAALHPKSAERIARYLPDAKLVYIVRHPLKRIESHWLHGVADGQDPLPLCEVLQKLPHIVDTSLYWKQINVYRSLYGDDRILILFFEDFVKEPGVTIERCCEFLGVDPKLCGVDLSLASHLSADKRVDGQVIHTLQRMPAARVVKNLLPRLARGIIPAFRRPLPSLPAWPGDLRREVCEQLAGDSAVFLKFYGKPADFWRLD